MALSRVVDVGRRWLIDNSTHHPIGDAVAAVHNITRDRVLLGVALGAALSASELDTWKGHRRLADLYRAAGADEQIAAAELAWFRDNTLSGQARSWPC